MIKPLPWPAALPPEAQSSTMVSLITLDGPDHTLCTTGNSSATWEEPPNQDTAGAHGKDSSSQCSLPRWLQKPVKPLCLHGCDSLEWPGAGLPVGGKSLSFPMLPDWREWRKRSGPSPACRISRYSVKLLHFQHSHISSLSHYPVHLEVTNEKEEWEAFILLLAFCQKLYGNKFLELVIDWLRVGFCGFLWEPRTHLGKSIGKPFLGKTW